VIISALLVVVPRRPGAHEAALLDHPALDLLAGNDVFEHGERVRASAQERRLAAGELFRRLVLAAEPLAEIDAARDHAAVARRGADTEVAALQHNRLGSAAPQLEGCRQAAIARADDDDVGLGRRVLAQRIVWRPRLPPPRPCLEVGVEDVFSCAHLAIRLVVLRCAQDDRIKNRSPCR
jgi:hypothetical protein